MIKDSTIKRLNQAENFVELTKASLKFHLLRREATQNPIIITLLPARKDKPAFISD